MALLPLAGWAQATNLSGYAITFPNEDQEYAYFQGDAISVKPAITLKKDAATIEEASGKFNVVWTKAGETVTDFFTVGEYVVTVTANGDDTYGSLATPSRSFWVLRATNTVTNEPAVLNGPVTYADAPAAGYALVTTEPTVSFGTVKYMETLVDVAPVADATEWSETAPKTKKVGTHYVWIKVDGTSNYKPFGPVKIAETYSVEITGTNLTENTDYKVPTALDEAGIPFTNTAQNLLAAGGTANSNKVTEIQYSLNQTNWSATIPTATNAGTYTVYWKAVAAEGYYDATGYVTAKINAVAPTITPATKVASATYTGVAQTLLSAAGSASLGATPNYTIKYSANQPANAEAWAAINAGDAVTYANVKGTEAGWYLVTTQVVAGGNYLAASGTTEVQIQKATLTVTADAKTKVYRTDDVDLTATYTGWQNGETAESQTTAGKFTAATWQRADGEDAGEYAISINAEPTATNYTFSYNTANYGKFTITPKELDDTDAFSFTLSANSFVYTGAAVSPTITAASYTYGAAPGTNQAMADPADFTYVAANNINAGENTAQLIITGQGNFKGSIVKNFTITPKPVYIQPSTANKVYGATDPDFAYTLVSAPGAAEVDGAVLNGTVTLSRTEGENVGTYKIYVVSYEAAANDNYKIADDQIVNTPASEDAKNLTAAFTINPTGDGLVLKFKSSAVATKVYGNADPVYSIDDLEYVSGFVGDDTWDVVKPTLSVPVFAIASQNVGAENNQVTVSGLASTNYPNVSVQPLTFTVTARPLVVTVKNQTVEYGTNIETDSNEDAYWTVADGWNGTHASTTTDTKADLNLTLSTHDDYLTYGADGTNNKTYNKVIEATIDNDNYTLDTENSNWGNLTVTPSEWLILSDNDANVFTKITAHDGQNKKVKVVFNRDQHLVSDGDGVDRTWAKEKWNSIVLPFDMPIADLSSKFGYAIFNVADADNTKTGSVAFKIEMAANLDGNIIPANTPLLIKTNKAIANGTTIEFGVKEIVAPEAAQFGSTINATGYKFMGTYAPMTVAADTEYADDFYFWTGTTDKPSRIKSTSTAGNTWIIKPFSAYVDQSAAGGARDMELEFTYEDLGGQTTTVRGISVDEINSDKVNEGIYNLNGVKMNNVPTQKGIYIMNGKKVVVK